MTFWQHFALVLGRKPLSALAALYWHLTRRRVRARNRLRVASADLPSAYAVWISLNETAPQLACDYKTIIKQWPSHPVFAVVVHSTAEHSSDLVLRSIASVEAQTYPYWTIVEGRGDAISAAVDATHNGFVVPLRSGDELAASALFRFAEAFQTEPNATILYGDHDHLDDRGRRSRPWFKPRWNEELFFAQDYISAAAALDTNLVREAALSGGDSLPSLLLAATSKSKKIVHVPHILVHTPGDARPANSRTKVVARHLQGRGAACVDGPHGTVKVEWPLPEVPPLVSIIIPTKDNLDLLRPCVNTILEYTRYPNFEILIVDNESVEERTAAFLAEIRQDRKVRVLTYDRPFNYSAINNFAIQHSRGSYVCLLNNDTEVLGADWLKELMRYAARPDIGAAGGKLLYGDGSIQHAGVVVGIGDAAGHAHRFLPRGEPGYFCMPHVCHFVSAVTGACLLVDKNKFAAVGGFDEHELAIAFNDVDLCLKLEAAGWRNVYVPHAVLVHHESKSRGSDMAPGQFARYERELAVLQDRWRTKTYRDPLHNPNLDRYSETYVFRL